MAGKEIFLWFPRCSEINFITKRTILKCGFFISFKNFFAPSSGAFNLNEDVPKDGMNNKINSLLILLCCGLWKLHYTNQDCFRCRFQVPS